MRASKLFLSLLLSVAIPGALSARTITGVITSAEESTPLEGVAVAVKGTKLLSGSQADGIYYINISDKDSVLIFSYPGYQTTEIRITASNEYNIALHKQPAIAITTKTFNPLGNWRGVFVTKDSIEIPFLFEISSNGKDKQVASFINGSERFEAGQVIQHSDSLFIALDQFDNELAFKIADGELAGVLRKQDQSTGSLQVKATRNKNYRFESIGKQPAGDISGTYAITINTGNNKEEKAVGLFKQEGQKLSATFLRVTGDSRYLDGIVEGNEFYLSGFIGSSPSYYKGQFTKDGQLTGEIIGIRGKQAFTGKLDEDAALPNAYGLTLLKEGYTSLDFSFPDVDGNKISLSDKKFDNKVVVIAITGTWCPNCIDEAAYLAPWYKANKKSGVEVIALHYERQTDSAFVKKVLTRFKDRFDIRYDQLIAGPADKQFVATSLPALNTFLAFPTTIIVDKNKKVAQIHTGYSGPATGKYYEEFKKEFNEQIDALLKK